MKNKPKHHCCNLCGYKWTQRGETLPKSCPNCKRYDWHRSKGK